MKFFGLGKMTLGSLFKKPETLRYPFEKREPPRGLKGHIVNDPATCILCGTCVRVCSTGCLAVDRTARTWTIDRFQCVQCGACARACPPQSLRMEPTYIAPSRMRSAFTLDIPEPNQGAKESVRA